MRLLSFAGLSWEIEGKPDNRGESINGLGWLSQSKLHWGEQQVSSCTRLACFFVCFFFFTLKDVYFCILGFAAERSRWRLTTLWQRQREGDCDRNAERVTDRQTETERGGLTEMQKLTRHGKSLWDWPDVGMGMGGLWTDRLTERERGKWAWYYYLSV